jgi:hypothetical protein
VSHGFVRVPRYKILAVFHGSDGISVHVDDNRNHTDFSYARPCFFRFIVMLGSDHEVDASGIQTLYGTLGAFIDSY